MYYKGGENMSVISIRVNDDEKAILENASKIYGCGISSMVKQLAFEKLEDEYDMKVIKEYEAENTYISISALSL